MLYYSAIVCETCKGSHDLLVVLWLYILLARQQQRTYNQVYQQHINYNVYFSMSSNKGNIDQPFASSTFSLSRIRIVGKLFVYQKSVCSSWVRCMNIGRHNSKLSLQRTCSIADLLVNFACNSSTHSLTSLY